MTPREKCLSGNVGQKGRSPGRITTDPPPFLLLLLVFFFFYLCLRRRFAYKVLFVLHELSGAPHAPLEALLTLAGPRDALVALGRGLHGAEAQQWLDTVWRRLLRHARHRWQTGAAVLLAPPALAAVGGALATLAAAAHTPALAAGLAETTVAFAVWAWQVGQPAAAAQILADASLPALGAALAPLASCTFLLTLAADELVPVPPLHPLLHQVGRGSSLRCCGGFSRPANNPTPQLAAVWPLCRPLAAPARGRGRPGRARGPPLLDGGPGPARLAAGGPNSGPRRRAARPRGRRRRARGQRRSGRPASPDGASLFAVLSPAAARLRAPR